MCNDQGELPCTEYQCRSLGQACELINKGTGEERCVWINRDDVNAPEIEAWDFPLSKNYTYNPAGITFPHEADRGVRIESDLSSAPDKCIPTFTPIQLGISIIGGGKDNAPEPAKCKIDSIRKDNFEEMNFYMSSALSKYNHSYFLDIPGLRTATEEGILLENDGEFNVYVRCMDANGNSNIGNFVFNFCIEPGPDTTPPRIIGNVFSSTIVPVRHGLNETDVQIYLDEPASCRWSHDDRGYADMGGEMICQEVDGVEDLRTVYTCQDTLTGIKDRTDNEFYFRCNDSSGNINRESYKLTLVGTRPLVIDSAGPNEETIKDSTGVIKVTLEAITSAGYNEGDATCYYSADPASRGISFFYDTGISSYTHTQNLWLSGSTGGVDYTYYIECKDGGGNIDNKTITFTVQTDLDEPRVVRAYHEEQYLKIITDEPAECVYDVVDCRYSFEDGIRMTSVGEKNHFTNWNTETNFHIKCRDDYENQPDPDLCSITVKPFEF